MKRRAQRTTKWVTSYPGRCGNLATTYCSFTSPSRRSGTGLIQSSGPGFRGRGLLDTAIEAREDLGHLLEVPVWVTEPEE